MSEKCITCGSIVKVVGNVTKHYEPIENRQIEDVLREFEKTYGGLLCKDTLPSMQSFLRQKLEEQQSQIKGT